MRAGLLLFAALLGACELVVGADFDDKTLENPSSSGAGGGKLALGAPCTSPDACQSGHCADGVCCDAGCEGECVDCALEGSAGTCTALAAATSCRGGRCDGAGSCATGVTRWAKRFGDSDFEQATACAFDSNGAVVVAGRYEGSIDIDGDTLSQTALADGYWIFVAKFDAAGGRQWSLALGAEGDVDVTGLAVDASGGPAIIGTYQGVIDVGGNELTSLNERGGYVIKLDGEGVYQWHAGFSGSGLLSRNDSLPDILLQHVALGETGEAYVTGAYVGTATIGTTQLTPGGNAGIYVARIDEGGTVAWAKSSASDPGGLVAARGIGARPGGGAVIAGAFEVTDVWFGSEPKLVLANFGVGAGHDPFVVAYDGAGSELWARDHGADAASQIIESLAIDPSGNVLVAGSFGGLLNFGGGNLVHPSGTSTSSLEADVFLAKLNGDADYVSAESFGPFHAESFLYALVASDGAGNVVLAGQQQQAQVDFGVGELEPKAFGWFVRKASDDGDALWARAFGVEPPASIAPVHHFLWDVAADPQSGAIALCGEVVESVDYGTGLLAQTSDAPDAVLVVLDP